MLSNKDLLSQTISYLRFPLIVGVILIHFNLANGGISFHGIQYGLNCADWYHYFVIFFSDVLASLSVPIFFIISGFLFFYGKEFNLSVYVSKLKKRIRTLLIPYILWNIITILNQMIRMNSIFSSIFPNLSKTEFHFSLVRVFNTFFNNTSTNGLLVSPIQETITSCPVPINVPLWFIRDLMIFVLLTPIIYRLIKRTKYWFLVGLILLNIIVYNINNFEGYYFKLIINYLIFFSWGAYYSINGQNIVEQISKLKYVAYLYLPFALLDLFTKDYTINIYIHMVSIYSGIIMVFVFVSCLLNHGKIKVNYILTNSSFFVFAFHSLIISDLAKVLLLALRLPDTTYVMLGLYLIVPTLTILICIGLYLILKRYTPSLCNLLTGGR